MDLLFCSYLAKESVPNPLFPAGSHHRRMRGRPAADRLASYTIPADDCRITVNREFTAVGKYGGKLVGWGRRPAAGAGQRERLDTRIGKGGFSHKASAAFQRRDGLSGISGHCAAVFRRNQAWHAGKAEEPLDVRRNRPFPGTNCRFRHTMEYTRKMPGGYEAGAYFPRAAEDLAVPPLNGGTGRRRGKG